MKITQTFLIIFMVAFMVNFVVGCSDQNDKSNDDSRKQKTSGDLEVADGEDEEKEDEAIKKQMEEDKEKKTKEPVKARGLYLSGWTVGIPEKLEHFVDLANSTEINAYVVDIKDEDGKVGYSTQIESVKDIDGWQWKYNVENVVQTFKENDIYLIGRLVVNKDDVYASAHPDHAIRHVNGSIWRDDSGRAWIDPYAKEAWQYNIDIAKEALEKGFDEIQFDYIRFENDGPRSQMDFWRAGDVEKYEIIDDFLDFARKQMPDAIISADVFGIICESSGDTEKIGQNLDTIGKNIHYISPMVYPSHYAWDQVINEITFERPNDEPYGVVYNTLVRARDRIAKIPDYKADVRPFLQDNYMGYKAEQVRAQIDAVYDAGYEEWLIWSANNVYSEDAFKRINEE